MQCNTSGVFKKYGKIVGINDAIQDFKSIQEIQIYRVADQAKRRLVTTSEPAEDCYDLLFDSRDVTCWETFKYSKVLLAPRTPLVRRRLEPNN
ncbi:hypothetical protein Syun_025331 [Stephania yunnanensis]|uniref:Uncharacterized protein n=1 Tax=Stephania yunnanensis TaxID=152371 RepID=A0AAP0ERH6_9MAGN